MALYVAHKSPNTEVSPRTEAMTRVSALASRSRRPSHAKYCRCPASSSPPKASRIYRRALEQAKDQDRRSTASDGAEQGALCPCRRGEWPAALIPTLDGCQIRESSDLLDAERSSPPTTTDVAVIRTSRSDLWDRRQGTSNLRSAHLVSGKQSPDIRRWPRPVTAGGSAVVQVHDSPRRILL